MNNPPCSSYIKRVLCLAHTRSPYSKEDYSLQQVYEGKHYVCYVPNCFYGYAHTRWIAFPGILSIAVSAVNMRLSIF